MKTNSVFLSLLTVLALAVFSSCEKYRENREVTSEIDHAIFQNFYDDVFYMVRLEAEADHRLMKTDDISGDTCATTTIAYHPTDTFPAVLTIDLGAAGCIGDDGRIRSGKIIAEFSGPFRQPGTTVQIALTNYTVQSLLIEGSQTFTNIGPDADGNMQYTVEVPDTKITTPEGDEITWSSTRQVTWIGGLSTLNTVDDEFSITGTATGINRDGRNYNAEITERLHKRGTCKHVDAGVVKVTPDDLKVRYVDYGSGKCDNIAISTIGNKEYNIYLD